MTARVRDLKKHDWKAALKRTYRDIKEDNISLIAAGVAFYTFLSIFPALAAMLSIYGLMADPTTVESHVKELGAVLPKEASDMISTQLHSLASTNQSALSISLVVAILLALWSANKATKNIFQALTIVYEEKEQRGFFKLNAESLFVTTLMIVGFVVLLVLVAVLPALLEKLGLGNAGEVAVQVLRWPAALVLLLLGLAILYRIGPDRRAARWRWVTPGAIGAALLWLLASIGLSLYVSYFGKYNETYGSVAAVVIMLLWLFFSAYAILLGGELNSALEHQTPEDTTRGPDKPMGKRGAYVADTVPAE